jgi:hypothetical protein
MAKLDPKPFPFPALDFSVRDRTMMDPQTAEINRLQALSDAIDCNNPKANLKGALLRWQRADGYAYYIVTQNSPLTVAHIDFCDGYGVEAPLLRALNRADILGMLRQTKSFNAMFREKKG